MARYPIRDKEGQRMEISPWNPGSGVRKVRAVIEYDGTDYLGFQIQAQGATIQGELENVLATVAQERIRVIGAGRTDAGVHARGQVIHFSTAWKHSLGDLQRALNALLPQDIVVRELGVATEGFHARYSALSRDYRYTVLNQPLRSPLEGRFAYHFPHPLQVEAMAQASRCLIGTHDFASFGRPPQGENTVRQVYRVDCMRQDRFVHFDIVANAFLRRMVRSIVSMLLSVGTRELSPADFEQILLARDRSLAGAPAPAHGLCLMKIYYPNGFGEG